MVAEVAAVFFSGMMRGCCCRNFHYLDGNLSFRGLVDGVYDVTERALANGRSDPVLGCRRHYRLLLLLVSFLLLWNAFQDCFRNAFPVLPVLEFLQAQSSKNQVSSVFTIFPLYTSNPYHHQLLLPKHAFLASKMPIFSNLELLEMVSW